MMCTNNKTVLAVFKSNCKLHAVIGNNTKWHMCCLMHCINNDDDESHLHVLGLVSHDM